MIVIKNYKWKIEVLVLYHGDKWKASRHGPFTPDETSQCVDWIKGWVDLRTRQDILEKTDARPTGVKAYSLKYGSAVL